MNPHDEFQAGPGADRVSAILPGAPRLAALDALLRDVDRLRLGMETDLTLAAAAVEAGAHEVAHDLVQDEIRALRAFEARSVESLTRLHEAESPAEPEGSRVVALTSRPVRRGRARALRRVTRFLPAAPVAAAAAVLVGVLGLLPGTPGVGGTGSTSAVASWSTLERLSADGAPAEQVRAAAAVFHRDLMALVAASGEDPVVVRRALNMLQESQLALLTSGDPRALTEVLAQSRALAAALSATLPVLPLPGAPTGAPVDALGEVVDPVTDTQPSGALRPALQDPAAAGNAEQAPPKTSSAPAPAPSPSAAPAPRPAAPPAGQPLPAPGSGSGTGPSGPSPAPAAPAEQRPGGTTGTQAPAGTTPSSGEGPGGPTTGTQTPASSERVPAAELAPPGETSAREASTTVAPAVTVPDGTATPELPQPRAATALGD